MKTGLIGEITTQNIVVDTTEFLSGPRAGVKRVSVWDDDGAEPRMRLTANEAREFAELLTKAADYLEQS